MSFRHMSDCLFHATCFTEVSWACGGGGLPRILCGRWLKPNFLRKDPKFCAADPAASCSLFAFSTRFLEDCAGNIPSSGWSGGSWRRCPQPGRFIAKAWYHLLNLQRKRAAATVVQLKLLTTHGIQDFDQWQNFHNSPPPPAEIEPSIPSRSCRKVDP
jgi:hypothetical protein